MLVAAVAAAALGACSRQEAGGDSLVERGERIYSSNCIACHHRDPRLDGPLGPAIAGASLELVEARVLRAEYPPGYEPRRDTRQMPAQPYLAPHVPALAAYLGSLDGDGG